MLLGARTAAFENGGGETMETMTFGSQISNAAQVYSFFRNNPSFWNCMVFRKNPITEIRQLATVIVDNTGASTNIYRDNGGTFGTVSASVAYTTLADADEEFVVIRPMAS